MKAWTFTLFWTSIWRERTALSVLAIRRQLGALALAIAVASLTSFAASAQPLTPTAQMPVTIGKSVQFHSAVLSDERTINIYLPAAYEKDSTARFPVLYVIDGGISQDFIHIAGLANLGGLSGMYPDMIVVGVETKDRRHELTTPTVRKDYLKEFPTLGGAAKFRRMLADEIMPYVKANYRGTDRSVVIGESLAGYWIVDTFLNAPSTFTDYIAISPSLWWDELDPANKAAAALAQHDGTKRSLYLTVANEGGDHQKGNDMVAAALKAAAPKNLRWTYQPRPNEEHSTIYHGAALDALRWTFPKESKK